MSWNIGVLALEPAERSELKIAHQTCPNCNRPVVLLALTQQASRIIQAYPRATARAPLDSSVPKHVVDDFKEACLILHDSPKASAALGRRCLQAVLRETAKVTPSDLRKEIQEVLDGGYLPNDLANSLDAVRQIGNFATHPIKSTNTGEIAPVEAGEAEWVVEVLEELFEYFYVRPKRLTARRDKLNQKLTSLGKPQLKTLEP